MNLQEAISALQRAAGNWCEYLTDNGREEECEEFDRASMTLGKLESLIAPPAEPEPEPGQPKLLSVEVFLQECDYALDEVAGDGFTFVSGDRRSLHYVPNFDAEDYPHVAKWLPLHVYEHGNTIFTPQDDPRTPGSDCPWDGVNGGALIGLHNYAGWDMEETAAMSAVREICETLTAWANGWIYGWTIETLDGETVDDCSGYAVRNFPDGAEHMKHDILLAAREGEIVKTNEAAAELLDLV